MKTTIKPYEELDLKIYGYTLRNVPSHQGYVKIGETNRIVNTRIKEQLGTAGLNHDLLFERIAQKSDGTWFHDRDLHRYLLKNNIRRENFGTSANEWFYFNGHLERAEDLTDEFINRDHDEIQISHDKTEYILRYEQKLAVEQTYEYYEKNREFDDDKINQFLWNAKPRFGKTLTTYDFIRKIEARNVLIVTNRPAIANSWYEDFHKFIGWRKPHLRFVSETDSLKDKAISREEFINNFSTDEDTFGQIVFISLQDLKGAKFAGGDYDKLNWVPQINWDLLVIDEAHEGVETDKTERAFNKINRSFTLHLSGTPFKALSNEKFSSDQIYNWSYLDEQKTKLNWNYNHGTNPYEQLPTLNLFTYQMSKMIESQVEKGIKLEDDTNMDYAFDLNEFFSTNDKGEFEYENSVKAFLNNLCTGKFPFSKDEYRKELNHTFWLLPWVSSAKALEKLLRNHPIFGEYRIILAAGDGITLDNEIDEETEFINNLDDFRANEKSYDRVKKGIKENEKTITISVGQLTTGVTIPEWTAVFMLNNIKSPSLYFQAAFRAQNPYEFEKDGKLYRKENSYIFDFAPDRTLQLYDEFAVNLNPAEKPGRKNNIKELVNFFPVIGEDELGSMKELDAEEVLAIPRLIKAKEVVKRGFMSNLLFNNISGIFRAPDQVKAILEKIRPEEQKKLGNRKEVVIEEVMTDDDGNVEIPESITINTTENLFGEKIYKTLDLPNLKNIKTEDKTEKEKEISKFVKNITKDISKSSNDGFEKLREEFSLTKRQQENVKDTFEKTIEKTVEKEVEEYVTQLEEIEKTKETKLQTAVEDTEKYEVIKEFEDKKIEIENTFSESIDKNLKEVITETVEKEIVKVEEKKKNKTEESVRQHLRGFSRTIPSFLMAYGTEETTLRNFEKNIDEDVFEEISGITVEEFRKLRDGFDYVDDEGNNRKFKGLFDEIVFNTSIKHFFEKKIELSNYFDENLREDIFDYIPPQETNQIYTPKSVVKMMVDKLEQHNPEIFKDYNTKFADLYSKSGLYITEIVKRLNKGLKEQIPNRDERIKHILENQVYGVCPSKIIYNIVKNYVFGNFENINTKNLIILDTAKAAENGKMKEELEKVYGERNMKFDVIIGNPPYQEEAKGTSTSDDPIYHLFMDSCYEISDRVMLITPARFLFNAGKTPKNWNNKMLNDEHLKVVFYEPIGVKVFPNTDIKGGIAVTYRDINKTYEPIKVYTQFEELNSILKKVSILANGNLKDIAHIQTKYQLDNMYEDYPYLRGVIGSNGRDKRLRNNAFEKIDIFTENKNDENDIEVVGLLKFTRVRRYIDRKYILEKGNLHNYKVILPIANGTGKFGEHITNPFVGYPGLGHTQTFISFGRFETIEEAENCLLYVKTKFCRTMLHVLKVTQMAGVSTWRFVPLQDFTENSDIDWSKSVSEIDKQLYKKYGLDEKEIEFIEKNVKPME